MMKVPNGVIGAVRVDEAFDITDAFRFAFAHQLGGADLIVWRHGG
jgi:hypothetical protein